jgi:glutathione S-transferase
MRVILHHYGLSPFSEKVRLAFGVKGMHWTSVEVPMQPPRPHLIPLIGGYRRIPVAQAGANFYCDTTAILPMLERIKPKPTLYPAGTEGVARALSFAFERFTFMPLVNVLSHFAGDQLPPDLVKDRKDDFIGVDISKAGMADTLWQNLQRLHAQFAWLKMSLSDGRRFLFGEQPSAADLSCFHLIWLVRANCPPEADAMMNFQALAPWYERVISIGHATREPMTSEQAMDVAARSTPTPPDHIKPGSDPNGLVADQLVTVTPDDNARKPVSGELVASDAVEIVIRRRVEPVGEIYVHFPRAGFDVVKG